MNPNLPEQFEELPFSWTRRTPIIVTEASKKMEHLEKIGHLLQPYIWLKEFENPTALFEYLKEHRFASILVSNDILKLRKNYTDILEGAVCYNPMTGDLVSVEYQNRISFVFKGRIIIFSEGTYSDLKSKDNLRKILRDSKIV